MRRETLGKGKGERAKAPKIEGLGKRGGGEVCASTDFSEGSEVKHQVQKKGGRGRFLKVRAHSAETQHLGARARRQGGNETQTYARAVENYGRELNREKLSTKAKNASETQGEAALRPPRESEDETSEHKSTGSVKNTNTEPAELC